MEQEEKKNKDLVRTRERVQSARRERAESKSRALSEFSRQKSVKIMATKDELAQNKAKGE